MARRNNAAIALFCVIAAFGMVGAAYAAVPLYRLFCQVTGFDGTVRRAEQAPDQVLDKSVTIRFDTNVRDLPMTFEAEQVTQRVHIGETGLAYFKVTNNSDRAITGRAIYSVVPEAAGAYFQKLECFCFTEQTVQPGATMEFPVVYFVDPQYASDPETKKGEEITLSYTFFPVEDQRAEAASPLGEAAPGRL